MADRDRGDIGVNNDLIHIDWCYTIASMSMIVDIRVLSTWLITGTKWRIGDTYTFFICSCLMILGAGVG